MLLLSFPICRSIRQLIKAKKIIFFLMACGLTSQSVVAEPNEAISIKHGDPLDYLKLSTDIGTLELNKGCSIEYMQAKVTDIINCPNGDYYGYLKLSDFSKDISRAMKDIGSLVNETNTKHSIEKNNLKQFCTREWEFSWGKIYIWGRYFSFPTWKQVEKCFYEEKNPQLVWDLKHALKIVEAVHLNLEEINDDGISRELITKLNENYIELKKHYPINNTDLKIKQNVKATLEKVIDLKEYKVTIQIIRPALTNHNVEGEIRADMIYDIRIDDLVSRAGVKSEYSGSKFGIYIDNDGKHGEGSWNYCENIDEDNYSCRKVGNEDYLSSKNGAQLQYLPDSQNANGDAPLLIFYAWDQTYRSKHATSLEWAQLSVEVKQVIKPMNNEPTFDYDKPPWEVDENVKKEFKRPVARDVDENKLTYRLEDPKNKFKLKGDRIVLEQKLDYETKPEYELILTADDNKGGIAELEITVRVKDVNEAPEITSDLQEYVIQDNKAGDGFNRQSIQFKLTATDQDSGDQDDLKYLIQDENGDHKNVYKSQYGILTVDPKNGYYKYSPTQETLEIINTLPFKVTKTHIFNLVVTDTGGLTATTDFTVKLQNTNNPPTLGKLTCFDTRDNEKQVTVLFDDGYYKCQIEINDPDTQTTAWTLKVGDEEISNYKSSDKFVFNPSQKDTDKDPFITVIDGNKKAERKYEDETITIQPTTAKTSGFLKGRFSEGKIKAHSDDSTLEWTSYRNKISYTVKHAASKNCSTPVKWDQQLNDKWHPVDIQLMDINGDTLDDLLVFSSDKTTTQVSIHLNRKNTANNCFTRWEELWEEKSIVLVGANDNAINFTYPTSIKSIAGLHVHSKPVRYFLLHSHITGKARVVALKFDSESKQLTLIEPTSDTTSEPKPKEDVAVLTADISWLGDWDGVIHEVNGQQESRFNTNAVIVGQLVTERKQDGAVNFSELTPEKVWVDYVTYELDDDLSEFKYDVERGNETSKESHPQPKKHLIFPEEKNMSGIQAHHLSSVWVHAPQPDAPELYSSLDQTKFLLQSTDLDMNDEPEYVIVRDNVASKKDKEDKLSAMTLQSEKAGEQSKHRRQLQQISTDAPLNIIHAHSPQLASEAGFITQTPSEIAKHIAANCKENKNQLFSQCLEHWKTKVEWHDEVKQHGEKSKKGRRVLAQLSSYKRLIDVFDQFYNKKALNPLEQFRKLRPEEFEKLADSHSLKIEKIMSAAFQGAEDAELLQMIAGLPEALPMVILIMLVEQHFLESQDIKETMVYDSDRAISEKEHSPADRLFNTKILDKNTFNVIDLINKYLHSEKLDLKNPSSQSIPEILELGNSGTQSTIQACKGTKNKLCVDDLFEISNLESKNPKINLINQDRDNFNKPKVRFPDDNQSIIEISVTIDEKKVRLVYIPIGVDSNNNIKFGLALMEHDVFSNKIIRKTWDYVDGEVILFKRGEFKSWQDAQQTKFDPHYVKAYYYGDYKWQDNQNKDQMRTYLDYTVAMNIASGSQSAKEISLPIREHYYYTKDKAGEGLKLKSTYIANLNDKLKKEGTSLAKFNCLQGGACRSNMHNTNYGVSEYYTVPGYVYRPIEDKWAAVYGLKITSQGLELLIDSGKKDISKLQEIPLPGYTILETSSITDISTTDELIKDEEKKYYFPSYKKQLQNMVMLAAAMAQKVDFDEVANSYIKSYYLLNKDNKELSKLDNNDKEELNGYIKSVVKYTLDKAYKQLSNFVGYSYQSDASDDLTKLVYSVNTMSVSELKKKITPIPTKVDYCPSGELVWELEEGSPDNILLSSMAKSLLDDDFVNSITMNIKQGVNKKRQLAAANNKFHPMRTVYKLKSGHNFKSINKAEGVTQAKKMQQEIADNIDSFDQIRLYRDTDSHLYGHNKVFLKGSIIKRNNEFYLLEQDVKHDDYVDFFDTSETEKRKIALSDLGLKKIDVAVVDVKTGNMEFDLGDEYIYYYYDDEYQRKFSAFSYRYPDNSEFTVRSYYPLLPLAPMFTYYKFKSQNNLGGFSQVNIKQDYPSQKSYYNLLQVYQLKCATAIKLGVGVGENLALAETHDIPIEADGLFRLKRNFSYDKNHYLVSTDPKPNRDDPDKEYSQFDFTTSLDFDLRFMVSDINCCGNSIPKRIIQHVLKQTKLPQLGLKILVSKTKIDYKEDSPFLTRYAHPFIDHVLWNPAKGMARVREYNPNANPAEARPSHRLAFGDGLFQFLLPNAGHNMVLLGNLDQDKRAETWRSRFFVGLIQTVYQEFLSGKIGQFGEYALVTCRPLVDGCSIDRIAQDPQDKIMLGNYTTSYKGPSLMSDRELWNSKIRWKTRWQNKE